MKRVRGRHYARISSSPASYAALDGLAEEIMGHLLLFSEDVRRAMKRHSKYHRDMELRSDDCKS
jgi:hypothetical protein